MKIPPIILLLIFVSLSAQAQLPGNFNLVSNGKFLLQSDHIFRDTNFENSACWIKATRGEPYPLGATTGAYWDTTLARLVAEVTNFSGGFRLYNPPIRYARSTRTIVDSMIFTVDNRRYAHNRLLEPLVAGQTYKFSMRVWGMTLSAKALSQIAIFGGSNTLEHYRIRNIGVYFSHTKVNRYNQGTRLNAIPQLNFTNYNTHKIDTLEFIELAGLYTATGGEQYITIGNFDPIKNFVVADENWLPTYSDTVTFTSEMTVTSVAIVKDTTQPMMELADFDLGYDTVICPATPVTLGGQAYFFHYLWNTGDTGRFITTSLPGVYWCRVDFGCGIFTDTIHVTLPPPPPAFDIKDTVICLGKNLQLQAPAGYAQYNWSNGATTGSATLNAPGKYWVRVTDACGLFSADTFQVTLPPPLPAFDMKDTIICQGKNLKLQAPAGYAQYNWSNGATTGSATLNAPGRYWVRITDACGSFASDTFQVSPASATIPGININSIPPIFLCEGTPITFVINSVGGGVNPQYQWYKNGSLIPGVTATTYRDSLLAEHDTLSVWMYSSEACPLTQPTISNKLSVRVYPVLTPKVSMSVDPGTAIGAGQTVTFTASPVNEGANPKYQWYINGNLVPNINSNVWTTNGLLNGDRIRVRLESSIPCPSNPFAFSNEQTISITTNSVGNVYTPPVISIYPTPVDKIVNITFNKPVKDALCILYDGQGRVVRQAAVTNQEHVAIDMSTLATGLYFYRLQVDNHLFSGKLTKQ